MSARFLVFLMVCFGSVCSAQDYVAYHTQLKEAKLLAVKGNTAEAAELYYLTFEEFEFRFARDCIHAVEIAAAASDTGLTAFFVEAGLRQGIPIAFYQQKATLNWFRKTENWLQVGAKADSLHQVYLQSINQALREEINQLFAEDQQIRARYYKWYNFLAKPFIARKWRKLNKQQVERLIDITREYGFLGERLIGIDLPTHHPKINANQLSAGMPIVILVHHYSKPNASIDELLFEQLKLGYIDEMHFATICDFEAEFGRKKFEKRGYYGLRFGQRGRKTNYYDNKRKTIGLPSFDEYKELNNTTLLTKFWNRLK